MAKETEAYIIIKINEYKFFKKIDFRKLIYSLKEKELAKLYTKIQYENDFIDIEHLTINEIMENFKEKDFNNLREKMIQFFEKYEKKQ